MTPLVLNIFCIIIPHPIADEMGLGKTLTALACLWTLIRGHYGTMNKSSTSPSVLPSATNPQGCCKGIIVCPSSLVQNWNNEIKKWFGVKLKPLVLVSSSGRRPTKYKLSKNGDGCGDQASLKTEAENIINSFRYGHASLNSVSSSMTMLLYIYNICLP